MHPFGNGCAAGIGTDTSTDIEVPDNLFGSDEEKKKYPDLELEDKHLEQGLPGSFTG